MELDGQSLRYMTCERTVFPAILFQLSDSASCCLGCCCCWSVSCWQSGSDENSSVIVVFIIIIIIIIIIVGLLIKTNKQKKLEFYCQSLVQLIFRMCSGLSYCFTMCFKCFSVLFFSETDFFRCSACAFDVCLLNYLLTYLLLSYLISTKDFHVLFLAVYRNRNSKKISPVWDWRSTLSSQSGMSHLNFLPSSKSRDTDIKNWKIWPEKFF